MTFVLYCQTHCTGSEMNETFRNTVPQKADCAHSVHAMLCHSLGCMLNSKYCTLVMPSDVTVGCFWQTAPFAPFPTAFWLSRLSPDGLSWPLPTQRHTQPPTLPCLPSTYTALHLYSLIHRWMTNFVPVCKALKHSTLEACWPLLALLASGYPGSR